MTDPGSNFIETIHKTDHKSIYKILFNSSADAMSIIDLDSGQFVDCNKAALELHDIGSREAFLSLSPAQLSPERQPGGELSSIMAEQYIQEAFKKGSKTFEWIHCRRNKEEFPIRITLSRMIAGKKNYIIAIGRDLTEQKRIESEREQLIDNLEKSLKDIKTLKGIIPICSFCKKIRNDKGSWSQLEQYISDHSEAQFSHGICDECKKTHYPDY